MAIVKSYERVPYRKGGPVCQIVEATWVVVRWVLTRIMFDLPHGSSTSWAYQRATVSAYTKPSSNGLTAIKPRVGG